MKHIGRRARLGGRVATHVLWVALALPFTSPKTVSAALGDHVWTKAIDTGLTAAVDGNGYTTTCGTFFGTKDFGGGPLTAQNSLTGDVFLARFDSSGDHVWSQQFTPVNQAGLFDIRIAVGPNGSSYISGRLVGSDIDFGGGTLSGATETTGVLACFDTAGNHQWSFAIGSCTVLDLAATATKLVGVGELDEGSGADLGGGVLTTAGQDDILVFELSPAGVHQWSQRFGDGDGQGSNAVAIDAAGSVVMAGAMFGTVDFGGGPLTAAGIDGFLTKLDSSGAHVWSRAVTGTITSGSSIRPNFDVAIGLAGEVALGGGFRSDIDLGGGSLVAFASEDIFVARYDAGGNHQWSAGFGNSSADAALSVDVDTAGNVLLAGHFNGSVDLGGGPLPSVGGSRNHFVGVFDPGGIHVFSDAYGAGSANWGQFDASNQIRLHGFGPGSDFGEGPVGSTAYLVKLEGTLNTPTGASVPVVPVDETTGESPVTMTFHDITASGSTSLVTTAAGPPPPGGLTFGSMTTYYDLSTSATFTGTVEVCFHYDEAEIPGAESDLTLQHYNAALPGWEDITASRDEVNNILCGVTTSFSPFAIAAPLTSVDVSEDSPGARTFVLVGNAPNPFNPSTTVFYEVPAGGGQVQLDVYDAAGRQVRELVAEVQPAGRHSVVWDGRAGTGARVSSGVYFAHMRARDFTATRKMVLVE